MYYNNLVPGTWNSYNCLSTQYYTNRNQNCSTVLLTSRNTVVWRDSEYASVRHQQEKCEAKRNKFVVLLFCRTFLSFLGTNRTIATQYLPVVLVLQY